MDHGDLSVCTWLLVLLPVSHRSVVQAVDSNTVENQWLEPSWNHDNMFETGVVRANEC